jgi:hypothetical protein
MRVQMIFGVGARSPQLTQARLFHPSPLFPQKKPFHLKGGFRWFWQQYVRNKSKK